MAASPKYLAVAEVALRTRYCRKTVYRAIDAGELVASKPRSRWRIAEAECDRWMLASVEGEGTSPDLELPAPVSGHEVGSLERLRAMESDAA